MLLKCQYLILQSIKKKNFRL